MNQIAPTHPAAAKADRVLGTLTRAFRADPPCRWLFPEEDAFARHFPALALALGAAAFRDGTLTHAEGGAALWLAPDAAPDEDAIAALVEAALPDSRHMDAFAVFAAMEARHPATPHWYLPVVGVEPARQGLGLGSALIRPVLERCDRTGVAAYLEATTPRSRALYERLGFRVTATIREGGCPPLWCMIREPR